MLLLPARYNSENLKRVIHDPSLLLREPANIRKDLRYYPNRTIGRRLFTRKHGAEIDVMERDWDNLLILDACRYDVFEDVNWLSGELSSIVSKGSHSRDFIDSTFADREFHDTIYVSGNVKAADLRDDVFHKMVLTYSDEYSTNEYSPFLERYKRYSPETVYELAMDHYERHGDKRLIVHFMQPHAPYLGPKAEALRDELGEKHDLRFKAWVEKEEYEPDASYTNHLLSAFEEGYGERKQLVGVYEENLRIVLEYVENLLDHVEGKTVVTADHGELLGDPEGFLYYGTKYAHIKNVYVPGLRIVPWLEIEGGERRTITPDDPIGKNEVDEEVLNEQLMALGYK